MFFPKIFTKLSAILFPIPELITPPAIKKAPTTNHTVESAKPDKASLMLIVLVILRAISPSKTVVPIG